MLLKIIHLVLVVVAFLPFLAKAQDDYNFVTNTYPYNISPSQSSAIDLNNDDLDDIIFLSTTCHLKIFLNSSSTFNVSSSYITIDDKFKAFRTDNPSDYYYTKNSYLPSDFDIGDVDGDHINDIAVANYGEPSYVNTGRYGVPGGISVLLGNNEGQFNLKQSKQFNLVDENPTVIKINDVDNDGDLDILTLLKGIADIAIFLNDGNGIYTESSRINIDNLPLLTSRVIDFGLSDIEKDGDLDILITYNKELRIYLNNGDGLYDYQQAYSNYYSTYASNLGRITSPNIIDFDEDGDEDILVVIQVSDLLRPDLVPGYKSWMLFTQLGYFVNNGNGNFSFSEGELLPINTMGSVHIGDSNHDGHKDIIVSGQNAIDYITSDVFLLLGNGKDLDFTTINLVSDFNSEGEGYFTYGDMARFNSDSLMDLYYFENTGKLHTFIQEGFSNHPPLINDIESPYVDENLAVDFKVSATDLDNDAVTLMSSSNLPPGSVFDAQTGLFTWTPNYDDAGVYELTFTAIEETQEALFDTATVTITVNNVNRAPTLNLIGNKTVSENQLLRFTVSSIDPDGDSVTLAANNLPIGASFDAQAREFTWTPDYNDAGNYTNIEFSATDDGDPVEVEVELITITVGDINRAPILNNPGPHDVVESEKVEFIVSAVDPDNDAVVLSVINLPIGATFDDVTGHFIWTPNLMQSGVYVVTFSATDDGLPIETEFVNVVITVGDNPTPIEQNAHLIQTILDFNLPQNVSNSYMANLQKVEQFILDGKITPALNQLYAFVNKLEQDNNQGLLTQQDYETLLSLTNDLISDLIN